MTPCGSEASIAVLSDCTFQAVEGVQDERLSTAQQSEEEGEDYSTQGLLPALCWLLQHLWHSLCSTAQGTCCFPLPSTYLGLMFGGGCFVQCLGVFTHCLLFWLHLHSCSSSSALLYLRLLSRPEPPSVLCLPWFCFTPWVCVHES